MNRAAITIQPASDASLRIGFVPAAEEAAAAADRLQHVFFALREARVPGLVDIVPAYETILVRLDPLLLSIDGATRAVRAALDRAAFALPSATTPRLIEVPVCYEPRFALDMDHVRGITGLEPERIIELHSAPRYTVRFIGFSPGFPYLDGLDAALNIPRLARPRPRIEPGSVALAAGQTGIYPSPTPGGWSIIGRTPICLFDPSRAEPSLLRPGDAIRFVPIDFRAFEAHRSGEA